MIIISVWVIVTAVFIWLVLEWSVTSTIGGSFIHDYSRDLLLDELDRAEMNAVSNNTILSLKNGKMKGMMIADSCHSIRSRYYLVDANNNKYRIPRFGQCHKDVKACFDRLKTQQPVKPKY